LFDFVRCLGETTLDFSSYVAFIWLIRLTDQLCSITNSTNDLSVNIAYLNA